ncbi:MAG: Rpn family recombination-promoting nuclease/putative transposase, partial [bacterium]
MPIRNPVNLRPNLPSPVFRFQMSTKPKLTHIKPDDALFREVFSRKDMAVALLSSLLPGFLVGLLDWRTLHISPVPGINSGLGENRGDLIYRISFKNNPRDLCIFVALEHQSSPERWMAFRLLEYCVLIWKFFLSAKPSPKRLPVIVPLVVYIGKRRWNAPLTLHELLDAPLGVIENLGPILPACGYLLADLSPRADGALPEEPLARAILRLMRAAKAGTIDKDIAEIAKSLRDHPRTESFHQL